MSSVSISAVIITLNEEQNIERCLDSLAWVDEIVIVDSGSTDRTVEMCRERNCRTFSRDWEGYAPQKNYAISQAEGTWVFSLDADEEVSPELALEIQAALRNGPGDVYSIPRRNFFLGKWLRHGGWYPDRQLRLFRRDFGSFKNVPVHEHIVPVDGADVRRLENALIHNTYRTVSDFIRKTDAYSTLEANASASTKRQARFPTVSFLTALPRKFSEVYFYKGGWRDGLHGLIAALLVSIRVFIIQVKIWETQQQTSQS